MNEEIKGTAEPVEAEVTTPEVEVENETEEETEEVEETERERELREAKEKAEEIANDQRKRAEIAEKKLKQRPPTDANALASKDLVAIVNAKVPEEDIDEVVQYAKYRNTSIPEILKDPIMKATLDLRAEERNTAVAANTSSSRRGSNRVPDDVLLSNASRGKLPDSDAEIARLMKVKASERK